MKYVITILFSIVFASPLHGETLIINNDYGGVIGIRSIMLDKIAEENVRVEIRGQRCFSACTMYLGVDDLCIAPYTRFGFHGPSIRNSYEKDNADIMAATLEMARNYPPELADWFMRVARFVHGKSMYYIQGRTLIKKYGYETCE